MKIIVLGGGVVGLAAAYYLARDGYDVAVVERNGGVGLETSYANGGQLSYSYVAPLAGPGVLPKIPPWLLRRDSPLRFRPALDPHQWRWCLEFVLACNRAAGRSHDAPAAAARLLQPRADAPLRRAKSRRSSTTCATASSSCIPDAESFESARRLVDYQASLGSDQQALGPDECLALEPALASLRPRLAGGIYTPSEDAGDCYEFCLSLERLLRAVGRTLHLGTEIRRLLRWRSRIFGVETSAGVLEADRYVLALGTASPGLVRPLGIRLPIYPLKGYSLTLPIGPGRLAPRISITDFKKKIVYARLGDELRVAGMADLAGYTPTIDEVESRHAADETRAAFPDASDFARLHRGAASAGDAEGHAGAGRDARYPNLLLDCGHGRARLHARARLRAPDRRYRRPGVRPRCRSRGLRCRRIKRRDERALVARE